MLFKFPKQSTIYGPLQVESRISNDSEISQNLNLWDQQGSSVIRSNLLVIPIKNSILYVEPIYLTTNNENSLPEVVRIVVAYKDKIVMAKTLDEALSLLFGTDFRTEGITTETSAGSDNTTVLTYDEVVEQIKAAYQNAKTSAQNGNWADYGRYLDQLEQAISQLDKSGASAAFSSTAATDSADIDDVTASDMEPDTASTASSDEIL